MERLYKVLDKENNWKEYNVYAPSMCEIATLSLELANSGRAFSVVINEEPHLDPISVANFKELIK